MEQYQKILDLLENKTVCLVGNSVEILNYNKGEFIDSHDVVIRLGRGIPSKYSDQIGRKMDIWATGFLRMNFWDKLPPGWKLCPVLLNRTRMHLTKPREVEGIPYYCTMFSDGELLEIYKEFGYVDSSLLGRPSNGFIVLLWLLKKAWVWNKLTLIGFDFFSKQAPFKIGEQHPFSWHLPKNSVDTIPHNVPVEKEYVLDLHNNGIIQWEILSDLEEDILDL